MQCICHIVMLPPLRQVLLSRTAEGVFSSLSWRIVVFVPVRLRSRKKVGLEVQDGHPS